MAVRVTCPNCGAALAVDARYAGELVLCGACQDVFVADGRELEDDYDYRPRRRRRTPRGEGFAVTSLVLGVLACVVFCCWPVSLSLGGLGAVFGALGLKSRSRGLAVAGLTLSLVGLIFGGGFAVVTTAGVVKAEYERGSQTL
ncbi:MAG TPA: MJ0042-type zinc finger domain-containing protein, partial [Gemmataceae bacterium]|nr:MJ0042-type zinc finger domain-containing protein [Gemmataceae bacterium]